MNGSNIAKSKNNLEIIRNKSGNQQYIIVTKKDNNDFIILTDRVYGKMDCNT